MSRNFKEIYKQKLYESVRRKLMMEADDYRGRDLEQQSNLPTEVNPQGSSTWMASATPQTDPSKQKRQKLAYDPDEQGNIRELGNGWWMVRGQYVHLNPPYRPVAYQGQIFYIDPNDPHPLPDPRLGGTDFLRRGNFKDGDMTIIDGAAYVYHVGPPGGWHRVEGFYQQDHNNPENWYWRPITDDNDRSWPFERDRYPNDTHIPLWNINQPPFNGGVLRFWHAREGQGGHIPHGMNPPPYDPTDTRQGRNLYWTPGPYTPGFAYPDQLNYPEYITQPQQPAGQNPNIPWWQNTPDRFNISIGD